MTDVLEVRDPQPTAPSTDCTDPAEWHRYADEMKQRLADHAQPEQRITGIKPAGNPDLGARGDGEGLRREDLRGMNALTVVDLYRRGLLDHLMGG